VEASPRYPWLATAVHLGQLARSGARWEVYLQTEPHPDLAAVRGRLHFLGGDRHRATGWVFLEWTGKDVLERSRQFSATELWSLLEAVAP